MPASIDLLIATCAEFPTGDEDGAALVAALTARGIAARWAVWDDPDVDWTGAPVLIRSTWYYMHRREQFLAWARAVEVLFNPAEVIAWNSDKRYLEDIAAHGLAAVPTSWFRPGDGFAVPDGPGEYVVKPSVGAGSRGAARFAADAADAAAAARHAAELQAAGRTVMVQPYLAQVDTTGEAALVYFDGVFSHACRKGAMLPAGTVNALEGERLFVEERISAHVPFPAERELADRVIAWLGERFGPLVYARIDLLPDGTGPRVIEVEVTEPQLFLRFGAGAADRLAATIERRLAGGRA